MKKSVLVIITKTDFFVTCTRYPNLTRMLNKITENSDIDISQTE